MTATSIIFSYFLFFVAGDVSVSSLHHNTCLKSFLSDIYQIRIHYLNSTHCCTINSHTISHCGNKIVGMYKCISCVIDRILITSRANSSPQRDLIKSCILTKRCCICHSSSMTIANASPRCVVPSKLPKHLFPSAQALYGPLPQPI